MSKSIGKMTWATVAAAAFFAVSCKDPKLASETDAGEMEEAVAPVPGDSFDRIRQTVIGQRFEALTLGARVFSEAEVRDISDRFIVVSHSGGVDEVPWSEVSEEVRERWGYDPSAESIVNKLTEMIPELTKPAEKSVDVTEEAPEVRPVSKPKVNPQQRALEIRQKEQMMEAQMAGIRTLESDLSRHSILLNSLRAQLQSTRALQSSQRSGGVRVERIGGESTLVDRKKEARQLEAQIKVEEQLVAQLSKSLQAATQQYQAMRLEVEQLRRE
jgi:hypothetical protein